jgi:hypothetical protein
MSPWGLKIKNLSHDIILLFFNRSFQAILFISGIHYLCPFCVRISFGVYCSNCPEKCQINGELSLPKIVGASDDPWLGDNNYKLI